MLEHYIAVGQQAMRCGYTTGTCAAAAARAAAEALLTGTFPAQVTIETPAGVAVTVEPEDCTCSAGSASCAVRKDGGDDIDATNGAKIFAAVTRIPAGIEIDGGDGVGRVTKAGLDQPVGAAAINSGPRRMIEEELAEALRGHGGGLRAEVSVPDGAALAQQLDLPLGQICTAQGTADLIFTDSFYFQKITSYLYRTFTWNRSCVKRRHQADTSFT